MRRWRWAVATGAATAFAYRRWIGPWQASWGATEAECAEPLPGDSFMEDPATQVTRAILIEASPEAVWPWIVQLGADRGGFYSYDWLENLFGLGIHSADHIVAEWQHLGVGDVVAADRARTGGWYVMELRPGEALVLKVADLAAGRPLDRADRFRWEFVWSFVLRPAGEGATRLLVRERTGFGSRLTRVVMAPVGPVSFVMSRQMLRGIKARAERGDGRPPDRPSA